MKMKNILNEWRVFSESEKRIDKGLLNIGQPDGIMRAFVDSLGLEVFAEGRGSYRNQFEDIINNSGIMLGDPKSALSIFDFIDKQIENHNAPDAKAERKELRRELSVLKKQLDSGDSSVKKRMRALFSRLKQHRENLRDLVEAKNGVSFYLAEIINSNIVDESQSTAFLFQQLAALRATVFMDAVSAKPNLLEFMKDNFYDFIEAVSKNTGANPASLWRGGSEMGSPSPSSAPSVVAAGMAQDWFFGNPNPWPNGGFTLYVKALESLLDPIPQGEDVEAFADAPTQDVEVDEPSDRMKSMMGRFGDFFGDE
jgi:hypothetical protein